MLIKTIIPKITESKDKELRKFLLRIGISSNIQGYHYILDAINFISKQKIHTNITTVYEFICKKHETTPSAVERSIRHAIQQSYKKIPTLNLIYHVIPDNSVFLYDLVFNFDILLEFCEE